MKTIFILFLAGAALIGCATRDINNNTEQRVMTDPGRVVILFSKPQKSFVELGTVTTLKSQPRERQSWQTVLREQAGAMGADAVLVDTSTLNNSNTPMVTGTGIRYLHEKP
ncbi:MAG: hypothetical protein JWQ71_3411 [Pedosphaera sp.]|nr:hypothetical protein [Pedosphaera sp.]